MSMDLIHILKHSVPDLGNLSFYLSVWSKVSIDTTLLLLGIPQINQ